MKHEKRDGRIVVVVGALKLAKALVLIGAGVVAMRVAPERIANWAEDVAVGLAMHPGAESAQTLVAKLWRLDRHSEQKLGVVALAYAAVFLVEGVGLLAKRRWAEWMTVVVTTSFIPFEIYEMIKEFGAGKLVTLIINVAIVAYLLQRRLAERRGVSRVPARRQGLPSGSRSRRA